MDNNKSYPSDTGAAPNGTAHPRVLQRTLKSTASGRVSPYIFRGRSWSLQEIEMIKNTIKISRYRIDVSRKVCEIINWRQANGQLKDAACREVLRKMEKHGLINLPPRHPSSYFRDNRGLRPKEKWSGFFQVNTELIEGTIGEITLKIASSRTNRNLWEYLIDKYHYLGYKRPVGASVKYLIYLKGTASPYSDSENSTALSCERLVGCIGFANAVLKLNLRDKWIGWTVEQKEKNLHLVINNVRFLILPWVRIKNLASKILSTASKQVQEDWELIYKYKPVLLETFVDIGKFIGTSYKASNWVCLGRTKGEGRCGMNYFVHNKPKDVYVYPLVKDYLRILKCSSQSKQYGNQ